MKSYKSMLTKINNDKIKFKVQSGIEGLKYGRALNCKIRQFIVINIKLKIFKRSS